MSDNQINIFGKIQDNKLVINNKSSLNSWLKNQKEGDDIVLRFTNQKDYHSIRQNRLIYKQFRIIAKEIGSTVEEVKTLIKYEFGLCHEVVVQDRTINICKSIADLSKKELSELIQNVDIWANQNLGLEILTFDDKQFIKEDI